MIALAGVGLTQRGGGIHLLVYVYMRMRGTPCSYRQIIRQLQPQQGRFRSTHARPRFMQDPNLHAMGSCHATIPLAGCQALLGARQRARTGLAAGDHPDAALPAMDGHSA